MAFCSGSTSSFWTMAVIELAGEEASTDRTPYSCAIVASLEKIAMIKFHPASLEHVVLALIELRRVKMELFSNLTCLFNHHCTPLRGSPVVSQTVINQPAEGSDSLLKWRVDVRPVRED